MVNTIEFYNILNKMSYNLTLQRILEQLKCSRQYLEPEIRIHPDYWQRFIQFCLNPEAEGHDKSLTPSFEKIKAYSNKLEKTIKAIGFCEKFLGKEASNEELTEKERITLNNIEIISKSFQLRSDLDDIEKKISKIFADFNEYCQCLNSKINDRRTGQLIAHEHWIIYTCYISPKTSKRLREKYEEMSQHRELSDSEKDELRNIQDSFECINNKISSKKKEVTVLYESVSIFSRLLKMIDEINDKFSSDIDSVLCCFSILEKDRLVCESFREKIDEITNTFQENKSKLDPFYLKMNEYITEIATEYEKYDFIWILYNFCIGASNEFGGSVYLPFPGRPVDQKSEIPFPVVPSHSSKKDRHDIIIDYLCKRGIILK